MISQSRYLVVYKDSEASKCKYFGPFTSLHTLEDFLADLPEPLPGGVKTYKALQPFTSEETTTVKALILRQRSSGCDLEGVIDAIINPPSF